MSVSNSWKIYFIQVDGVWGRGPPVSLHATIVVLLVIWFRTFPEFVSERLPLIVPPPAPRLSFHGLGRLESQRPAE